MRYCEITIAGSLLGIIGASGAAAIAASQGSQTGKDVAIGVDVGFGVIALGAVVTYLLADLSDVPEPSQTAQQRAQAEAWNLTKRAREAARTGDCARVKKIAPAIKDADPSFYDVVFMRDVAIKNCMTSR
jgi:hypothetical protein